MKLIVSGKTNEFTPELQKKFDTKLAKLSKFIEQRGEREAHLTHQVERHLHKIEIEREFLRPFAGWRRRRLRFGLRRFRQAVEKVEKQVVKLRNRWRDTHRDAKTVRSSKESWKRKPRRLPPRRPPRGGREANANLNGTRKARKFSTSITPKTASR